MKRPLILFSGGLDSTFLLQQRLSESDVEVLYIKGSQCQDKVKKELVARAKIIKILEKQTGYRVVRDHVIDIGQNINADGHRDWKFRQPFLWLTGALQCIDSDVHSELLIGYVNGDQILSQLTHIQQAWMSIQEVSRQSVVPVNFPLMYNVKLGIMRAINPEAYQHVWVCEMPDRIPKTRYFKACDRCDACLTRYGNLQIWEKKHKQSFDTFIAERLAVRKLRRKESLPQCLPEAQKGEQ